MSERIKITSPVDGSIVAERDLAGESDVAKRLQLAEKARQLWKDTSVSQRAALCNSAIDIMCADSKKISGEITWLMGRPVQYSSGEVKGLEERARYMINIAERELSDINISDKPGFTRFMRHEPLGTVLVLAPWNYPYLTAVNSIIPALMAGNCVLLKHSAQTLLCAERFYQAFEQAGFPEGVFQYLHIDHAMTAKLIKKEAIDFISFTGSVGGGEAIEHAAAGLFKGIALELGGKDPAYVMSDVNLEHAVDNLVDGAYFNSGQSCCGIERIYVHNDVYETFVEQYIDRVSSYKLGNPLETQTTLGPMVNSKAADFVRRQIDLACSMGAKTCIDVKTFPENKKGTPYLAPQVLINVNHNMSVMREESFGPIVGIMKVSDDQQAVELMNDSEYGLTASFWTSDEDRAISLGSLIQTGTVFMNRCDYLDPALAWVGVKNSGRGCSLSVLGYQQLTRPKSFHLKTTV
jgi:acyl-CoA reductase-like NAD-dependent aldehyde dehydrogenase